MEELLKALTPALLSIAGILASYFAAYIGLQAKLWFDTKQKRDIVESTVKYVEQIGKALGSEEKFEMAKAKAIELLKELKITVSDSEIEVLIESFVQSFTEHYK